MMPNGRILLGPILLLAAGWLALCLMLITGGCAPSVTPVAVSALPTPAPTTQQTVATVQSAKGVEDAVVASLELTGVIKAKNQANAAYLQAAVNAATAKYAADLTAGITNADALADAALAGIVAYEQAKNAAPVSPTSLRDWRDYLRRLRRDGRGVTAMIPSSPPPQIQ